VNRNNIIEIPRLLSLMTEVVAGREDFIYRERNDGCRYLSEDGQPDCLIGHVLIKAGVSPEDIRKFEGISPTGLPWFGVDSREVAYVAQKTQDGGRPWGKALENAVSEARYLSETRNSLTI